MGEVVASLLSSVSVKGGNCNGNVSVMVVGSASVVNIALLLPSFTNGVDDKGDERSMVTATSPISNAPPFSGLVLLSEGKGDCAEILQRRRADVIVHAM